MQTIIISLKQRFLSIIAEVSKFLQHDLKNNNRTMHMVATVFLQAPKLF